MVRRRVLVVDDEAKIRLLLRQFLEADGFAVIEAVDGIEALSYARQGVDLALLDVAMPGLDGVEVLRRLRMTSTVPVILVTARAEEVDQLIGLAVGADDYVIKPFSPRLPVAKCKAVLRRTDRVDGIDAVIGNADPGDPSVLRFEAITIDLGMRVVLADNRTVELTAMDFNLLVALASNPGRLLTRGQLLTLVWGDDFFGDQRVVDVHVRTLRLALGDDAIHPRVIQTLRAVGYRFFPGPEQAQSCAFFIGASHHRRVVTEAARAASRTGGSMIV